MTPHRPWLRAAEFLGGLSAWAVQFGLVYIGVSVLCGRGLGTARVLGLRADAVLTVAVSLACLAPALWLLVRALRRLRAGGLGRTNLFLAGATAFGAGIGTVAILFTALPALVVPACP